MKRAVTFLAIVLFFSSIRSLAQNPNLDKLNTYKIGFFTRKLNLTSQEAEKFWPVYNEYQRQKSLIQLEKVSLIRYFNQNESTLNDNQLTETGDKLINCIMQESSLAFDFHKNLKVVLPPAKVIKFYQAENQYKAQLLNELQGEKQQQQQQQQRPLQRRAF